MKLADLNPWWSARSRREKIIVSAALISAVAVFSDLLLTTPIQRQLKRAQAELEAAQTRWQEVQAKLPPPGSAENAAAQETEWNARRDAARERLAAVERQVGDAARLPEALRAITTTVGSTRLLALDLSGDPAAEATVAPGVAAAAVPATGTAGGPKLYRLPITLKLSGSYEELQAALRQIEQHAAALQWSSMALDASDWPSIVLTLKAHVLSREPRWGATS